MTTTDTNPKMQALGSNPGILLRASDYIGNTAELAYSSNYLDGKAVKGTYQGQILMETEWFKNGVLNNIVLPTLFIEASDPAQGTPQNITYNGQNLIDNLVITVYKRDNSGKQYETKELTVPYQTWISNGVGQMPVHMEFNRQATNFTWFDIRYEYKFVVSVGKLTTGQYLYLEGMYLQYVQNTGIMIPYQEAYGTDSVQAVPIIEGLNFTVTMDASGNFDGRMNTDFFNGTGGTINGQRSLVHAIDAVLIGFDYQTTADTSAVLTAGYFLDPDGGGGSNFYFTMTGLSANTAYKFYGIIVGYITPMAV